MHLYNVLVHYVWNARANKGGQFRRLQKAPKLNGYHAQQRPLGLRENYVNFIIPMHIMSTKVKYLVKIFRSVLERQCAEWRTIVKLQRNRDTFYPTLTPKLLHRFIPNFYTMYRDIIAAINARIYKAMMRYISERHSKKWRQSSSTSIQKASKINW